MAGLLVEASLDNGASFPIQLADTIRNPGTTSYVQTTIALPSSLQNEPFVKFRWRLVASATGSTGTFRIDDVSITVFTSFDVALHTPTSTPLLPSTGDTIHISATVKNQGVLSASSFTIDFFRDANNNSMPESVEKFATISGLSLAPGDSTFVSSSHPPLPFGDHRFYAIASLGQDENRMNDTATIIISVGYARGAMLVNEIMYAPLGDEPEWVELYNATGDTVNLRNWRFSDSNIGTKTVISTTDVKIPPRTYGIVARDAIFFTVYPTVTAPTTIASFSALNNTTPDAVVLYDTRNVVIDSVLYAPSWGGQNGRSLERIDTEVGSTVASNWGSSVDSLGRTPGRQNSIARLNYDLTLTLEQTKIIDNGQVLPGVMIKVKNVGRVASQTNVEVKFYRDANRDSVLESTELVYTFLIVDSIAPFDSVTSEIPLNLPSGEAEIIGIIDHPNGLLDERLRNNRAIITIRVRYEERTVVINEIMYDPLTGQNEWVEFFHRGSSSLDLARWQFSDRPTSGGSVNTFTITAQTRIVQPGDFVVVAADSTILSLFPALRTPPTTVHLSILNRSGGFSFGNDGDDVILRDHTGATIDSVSYSPRWHNPQLTDAKGRSLERINPNLGSNDQRNWSTASGLQGGSPGATNTIFTTSVPTNASLSFSPNPFSPDGDGFEDFCIIRYNLPHTTSLIQVRIFDIRGRLVRTLANLEPAGSSGELLWDGLDDGRQRVRIGPYIVFLEASGSEGSETSARGVVVVATKL